MVSRRVALACLLFASSIAAQQPKSPSEADFDIGLAAVHAQMQKARWTDALAGLRELVRLHPNQVYVQAQSEALAADLQTCAFYAVAKVPKISELLSGKIVSYDERSGRIKVVYADTFLDWQGEGDLLVNPLLFAGSYTITASGKAYPGGDSSFGLCFDLDPAGSGYFQADFGFASEDRGNRVVSMSARIMHDKGDGGPTCIAEGRSMAKPGKPFTAVVKVGEDRVDLLLDNKQLLKGKRQKTDFGQVGIWRNTCDEIVIEGRIEPSCFQSRIDELLGKQREAFDATFNAKKELPSWVFQRPDLQRTKPLSESWVPGLDERFSPASEAMLKLLSEGKHAEAAAALAKLGETDASATARTFLQAWLHGLQGRPELAEPICARLLVDDEKMTPARLLRAQALEEMGRSAEAIGDLETARQHDPGYAPVHEQLCVLLMRKNRTDEARRVVRDAKTKQGLWDEVAKLETTLAMAARGPSWPRRFSFKSQHYEVASDIDLKVCMDACRTLEESYVDLMAQLAWIKEDRSLPRFRVFLFSGESGYQEYNKAIIGEAVSHSAGLYTPVLKQLLIWNLPRREDMVRTIRHEGFHQFLDRIMDNPPTWLNEGTAEFWETAQRVHSRLQGGQVRTDHIATLVRSRKALPKLKDFAYGADGDFYANAQLRYAQGWALVHFLRKGPAKYTVLFDKLWNELRIAKGTHAALDAAFVGMDWELFEKDFWTHLTSLR